jgi:elongation factor G
VEGAADTWMQDNHRDITVTSAATSCVWRGCRLNIVELPVAERLADHGALEVLDAVVAIIDAERGVTEGMRTALALAEQHGIAQLAFFNKLDSTDANLAELAQGLATETSKPLLLQLPIGAGAGLQGIVDLVEAKATFWAARFGAPGEDGAIPADMADAADAARRMVIETVAPGAGALDAASLMPVLRDAVRAGSIVPVLCGSAFRNRGIRRLLDAVVDYLPAPSELPLQAVAADGSAVERLPSDDEPFAGLVFQTVEDPAAGKLTFVRIYSGVVAKGGQMLNSVSLSPERIGSMVRVQANHTEAVDEARTGDIVALAGLEHTNSGDTLCDPAAPVILERLSALGRRAKH